MRDKILDALSELIREAYWGGACYASTAMAHVLLKSQGIESIPCIGVVKCVNGEIFDHAWLEIDGKIYDLAIANPMSPDSTIRMYVPNSFGIRGEESPEYFSYGIDMDLDQEPIDLASDFSRIFNQYPFFNPEKNYFELTVGLGQALEFQIDSDSARKHINNSAWKVKR